MATQNFRTKEREEAIRKAQQKKRRRRKRQTAMALISIIIVCVITLCVLSLTVFFKATKFEVSGNTTYTAEEIISAAEISIGDNLFLISENKIFDRLVKRLPFIDEVKIKRVLPDTLKISVTETKEEICFSNGQSYFSANIGGKVIKEYKEIPENLMVITVDKKTKFSIGEIAQFNTEREAELFKEYFKIIEENNFDVNFINISDPYDSYMKVENRIIAKFGANSYFDKKAAYLKAGLSGASKNSEGIFDLSAWTPKNNQPVLTYCDISSYGN